MVTCNVAKFRNSQRRRRARRRTVVGAESIGYMKRVQHRTQHTTVASRQQKLLKTKAHARREPMTSCDERRPGYISRCRATRCANETSTLILRQRAHAADASRADDESYARALRWRCAHASTLRHYFASACKALEGRSTRGQRARRRVPVCALYMTKFSHSSDGFIIIVVCVSTHSTHTLLQTARPKVSVYGNQCRRTKTQSGLVDQRPRLPSFVQERLSTLDRYEGWLFDTHAHTCEYHYR